MGHRRWSQQTVQKWADHWAAELNLTKAPEILTNGAEFARRTGYRVSAGDLGIADADYTYVNVEGRAARAIRETIIHELLHLTEPSWPHWKVRWTAYDLAQGRRGDTARSARTQGEYLERAGRYLIRRDGSPRWARR